MTGTIFNKQTLLLAYVDDIDIVGRSLEAVCDAYLALEAEVAKIGLKIDKHKTKEMIAAGNRTILTAGQTVDFGDMNFGVVNEFVYLGAQQYSEESKLQIGAAAACKNICGHLTWHVRKS
jgi:hypothetical protein